MRSATIFSLGMNPVIIIAAIVLYFNCHSHGETIEVKNPVKFPMVINGKNAGFATAPAGSKLEIIIREENKIKVKYRNFEPVWINSSDAAEENKTPADSATTEQPQTVAFDPQKALEAMESNSMEALTSMMHGQKYPDPDRQGDLDDAVSAFVKAKAEISTAKKQKLDSEAEIKRLKRNAEVAGRPNRLNPNDTSGQERAQKIRNEADTLEAKTNAEIAEREKRLDTARVTLSDYLSNWREAEKGVQEQQRLTEEKKHQVEAEVPSQAEQTSVPSSAESNTNSDDDGDSNIDAEIANRSKKASDVKSPPEPSQSASPQSQDAQESQEDLNTNYSSHKYDKSSNSNTELEDTDASIGRRGPKIHGFQLGMSFDEFKELVAINYPSEMRIGHCVGLDRRVSIGDLIGKPGTSAYPNGFVADGYRSIGVGLYSSRGDSKKFLGHASATYIAVGNPKKIIYFTLERPMLQKLFKIELMSFDDFCQNFINNYSIPELKGTSRGGDKSMHYESPDGWKIIFEGYSNRIISVHLLAVPQLSEKGFGL